MVRSDSYDEVQDYLLAYARDDWLMLSIVVSFASGLVGSSDDDTAVAEMTMRLLTDLVDDGSPPGELVADDRDFVPWMGDRDQHLGRLRDELYAFVERGEWPLPDDICWFHHVPDQDV